MCKIAETVREPSVGRACEPHRHSLGPFLPNHIRKQRQGWLRISLFGFSPLQKSTAPKEIKWVTRESSIPAINFLFSLKKLVAVADPLHRALTCMESTRGTVADTHLLGLSSLSTIQKTLFAPDGAFTEAEATRLRDIIIWRFNQTISEPPQDVYILGSFGDPSTRNKKIYRSSNPLANTIFIPASRGLPPTPNRSPAAYIPDAAWVRIRKAAIAILRAEMELSERFPTHSLAKYNPQRAKDELDAQLVQYASCLYPFDQLLAKDQLVCDWWNVFFIRPDTRIIGFIFVKLFSICDNSMNEERAGSRMTYLYSKLRSRTDIKTMVKQIQITQWYSLLDSVTGRPKQHKKAKPVAKFRIIKSISACTTQPPPTPNEALPVALNDEGGAEWLSEEAHAQSRADRLAGCDAPYAHNHLEFVDQSPALLDILSDDPVESDVDGGAINLLDQDDEPVRKTSDVNWDD
ncbi:unnamed protein product [Rhizoctonia solani]|uniref:Uncharacterized protein n=1 Tax=Rhizoctonia solani TaxID=456999 RepID=A0A8H2XJH4_9AGAM|nr:unnamed protein product [Rhizoctonia solani]